jgi:hypothetical protein
LVDLDPTPTQELDPSLEPIWDQGSLANNDSLDLVFPLDEAILESSTILDRPWDDHHHRAYFLPELRRIEVGEFVLTMTRDRFCLFNPLVTHAAYAKVNMESIIETIPIDISITPHVMENVFVGGDFSPKEILIYTDLLKEFHNVFSLSYEEILRIDPRIIEH